MELRLPPVTYRRPLLEHVPASRPWRPVDALPVMIAVVLAAAYLLAPPMGADLSAQESYAALAREHWPALLDLRWYGGIDPLGYSVLSPPVMGWLGVRPATALGYLVAVVLVAVLLRRLPVRRPLLGGVATALCLTGDLASSRTTFGLGLALGVGGVLALTYGRLALAVVLAVLTALTSPVVGLFLGLAGAALVLSGSRRNGVAIGVAALVPTAIVGVLLGNGGSMPFALDDAARSVVAALVVAVACWSVPLVRWGGLLTAAMVVAAYALPTAVGSNAGRLPEMLGPPVLVAVAPLSGWLVAALTAGVVALQPPLYVDEVPAAGQPPLRAAFYAPLLRELRERAITGPVEVVPMRRHGESAVVAPVVPLARGWLRQVDVGRNPLFYAKTIEAAAYRRWLDDNAIAYVALARGRHDWAAGTEATLVGHGLPYLRRVWTGGVWRLYAVRGARPVVTAPGRVLDRDAVSLRLDLPAPGTYDLRLRWSRWLTASSGCLAPDGSGWTRVVVEQPATVRITGSLAGSRC